MVGFQVSNFSHITLSLQRYSWGYFKKLVPYGRECLCKSSETSFFFLLPAEYLLMIQNSSLHFSESSLFLIWPTRVRNLKERELLQLLASPWSAANIQGERHQKQCWSPWSTQASGGQLLVWLSDSLEPRAVPSALYMLNKYLLKERMTSHYSWLKFCFCKIWLHFLTSYTQGRQNMTSLQKTNFSDMITVAKSSMETC